jgi:hypothetical protein
MKKPNYKDTHVLEETLKQAYREQPLVTVDEQWITRVMREVRRHGPLKTPIGAESFGWFVWRLVPVSLALIALFAAGTLYFDAVSEYEVARFFVNNPVEFTLIESLGI